MTRYRWTGAGDGLVPADEPGQVAIIDSWLAADGRVRAFEAHTRRFSAACAELFGVAPECTRAFMRAVAAQLPAEGRWFPRAELVPAGPGAPSGGPRFQLWIRPAPAPGRTVRLWLSGAPDTRIYPKTKGPDLGWLMTQREAAVAAGADEAALLSPAGRILEGSTTSIIFWRNDTLCLPSKDVLPSVTRSLLVRGARTTGMSVTVTSVTPADLSGLEVWAVNALHGIRPVTAWVGTDIEPGPVRRAARWQRWLDTLAAPVMTDLERESVPGW